MHHSVATTQNQKLVVVDLLNSEAAHQIAQAPHLLTIAAKLLPTSIVTDTDVWLCMDTGQSVGNCDVVKTVETDTIFFAKRLKSDEYSRFVKNKRPEFSSFLSIQLHSDDGVTYVILQIVAGHPVPNIPAATNNAGQSRAYWKNHALLWGDWPVKSATVTKTCPW